MKCIVFLSLIILTIEANHIYLWTDNYSDNQETLTNLLKSELKLLSTLPKLMSYFQRVNIYFIEKVCANKNSSQTSGIESIFINKFNHSSFTLYSKIQNTGELIRVIKDFDSNFKLFTDLSEDDKIIDSKVTVYLFDENDALPSLLEEKDNAAPAKPTLNIFTYLSPTHLISLRSDKVTSGSAKARGLVTDGVFFNFTNSIFFYALSGSITHNSIYIPLQMSLASVYSSESSHNDTSSGLTLKFTSTEPYESVLLKFSFETANNQWYCVSINAKLAHKVSDTVSGKPDESIDFQCHSLRATLGMSYTCDDFKFYQSFPGQGDVFSLIFAQIQPFVDPTQGSELKFGYSDSCVYFITVPIISGLVVSLLLILLASLSINSLSNIQGLTRFENQNEFVYFGNN